MGVPPLPPLPPQLIGWPSLSSTNRGVFEKLQDAFSLPYEYRDFILFPHFALLAPNSFVLKFFYSQTPNLISIIKLQI